METLKTCRLDDIWTSATGRTLVLAASDSLCREIEEVYIDQIHPMRWMVTQPVAWIKDIASLAGPASPSRMVEHLAFFRALQKVSQTDLDRVSPDFVIRNLRRVEMAEAFEFEGFPAPTALQQLLSLYRGELAEMGYLKTRQMQWFDVLQSEAFAAVARTFETVYWVAERSRTPWNDLVIRRILGLGIPVITCEISGPDPDHSEVVVTCMEGRPVDVIDQMAWSIKAFLKDDPRAKIDILCDEGPDLNRVNLQFEKYGILTDVPIQHKWSDYPKLRHLLLNATNVAKEALMDHQNNVWEEFITDCIASLPSEGLRTKFETACRDILSTSHAPAERNYLLKVFLAEPMSKLCAVSNVHLLKKSAKIRYSDLTFWLNTGIRKEDFHEETSMERLYVEPIVSDEDLFDRALSLSGKLVAASEDPAEAKAPYILRHCPNVRLLPHFPSRKSHVQWRDDKHVYLGPKQEKQADVHLPADVLRDPEKPYSYSELRQYSDCPYRCYLAYVLRLPSWDASDRPYLSLGIWLHLALETYFSKHRDLSFDQQYWEACLQQTYQKSLASEDFMEIDPFTRRFFTNATSEWMPRYLERQDADKVLAVEHRFATFFAERADGTPIAIRGKIDRIDVLRDGGLRMTDYKLTKHSIPSFIYKSETANVQEKADLQMGMYLAAMREEAVSSLEYMSMQDGHRVCLTLDSEMKERYLSATAKKIRFLVERIEKGRFPRFLRGDSEDDVFFCEGSLTAAEVDQFITRECSACGWRSVCQPEWAAQRFGR